MAEYEAMDTDYWRVDLSKRRIRGPGTDCIAAVPSSGPYLRGAPRHSNCSAA